MRPDQRWFPTNRIDRAAWFANFSVMFAEIGPSLGFSQAEIDAVAADNAVLQYSVQAIIALEAQIAAVRTFDRTVTLGKQIGNSPQFPSVELSVPPPMVSDGIFERLERLVRRIRVAPAYTPAAGAQLGIIPASNRLGDPQLFVPAAKVAASADSYTFTVHCSRKSFHGFRVYYKRDSATEWEGDLLFSTSPATVAVTPAAPGKPEMLNVYVRMAMNNSAVSMPSNIHTVTIMP